MPELAVADRCSLRSLATEESLAGTASRIRLWLLVEHGGPWGHDGLLDARLPDGLGSDLRALERRTGARVLLVRTPDRTAGAGADSVVCCVVDTRDAWLGTTALDSIEAALPVDPRDRSPFAPSPDPLFVVCTHGRRDPCCAERGRPLAQALGAAVPRVWESIHVGGDRFAGNVVAFPHGLYFGRVEPEEGPEIARAYAEGRIGRLDRYRGRSSHPFPVQAAERALREHLALDRIDEVAPARARRRGDRAEVTFATSVGAHRVRLERILGPPMRLTCHASQEQAPPVWRPLAVERVTDVGAR